VFEIPKSFEYIMAPPRMNLYIEYAAEIYKIYLDYIAPEDMHVYSIDEVFLDVTHYLKRYNCTPKQMAELLMGEVQRRIGVRATAGVGPNMYLAKIAMDITAKHMPADKDGVRIAELDEKTYRRTLWTHEPITDFWRVGPGTARKLAYYDMYTMGDVAKCSVGKDTDFHNEDLLYKLFGINAELLIDHAWGVEPCTIEQAKNYKSEDNSLSTGQVLKEPYTAEKGRLIVREMADLLTLDLTDKELLTNQMVLTVIYDIENLNDPERRKNYHGPVEYDHYGRQVPKHAHGTENLPHYTASTRMISEAVTRLYDRIINYDMLIRKVYVVAEHVKRASDVAEAESAYEQMDIFSYTDDMEDKNRLQREKEEREMKLQKAVLSMQKKYGKNAVIKGMNLEEGAMTIERNGQIGGHKA
jgi:DNA polymerase V